MLQYNRFNRSQSIIKMQGLLHYNSSCFSFLWEVCHWSPISTSVLKSGVSFVESVLRIDLKC